MTAVAAARRAAARHGAVALLVLDVLIEHANSDGEAWPALNTIAEAVYGHRSGGGRRQVARWLEVLAADGLAVDTGQRVGQRKGTAVWRLPFMAPDSSPTGPLLVPYSSPTGPQLVPNSSPG